MTTSPVCNPSGFHKLKATLSEDFNQSYHVSVLRQSSLLVYAASCIHVQLAVSLGLRAGMDRQRIYGGAINYATQLLILLHDLHGTEFQQGTATSFKQNNPFHRVRENISINKCFYDVFLLYRRSRFPYYSSNHGDWKVCLL